MCKRVTALPNKVRSIWHNRCPSFKKSSSRWGLFATLLALSAFAIAIGGWVHMNLSVYVGFGLMALAVVVAGYWLIEGSKDTSATKEDIDDLANEIKSEIRGMKKSIDDLVNEIRKDRENGNITKK